MPSPSSRARTALGWPTSPTSGGTSALVWKSNQAESRTKSISLGLRGRGSGAGRAATTAEVSGFCMAGGSLAKGWRSHWVGVAAQALERGGEHGQQVLAIALVFALRHGANPGNELLQMPGKRLYHSGRGLERPSLHFDVH